MLFYYNKYNIFEFKTNNKIPCLQIHDVGLLAIDSILKGKKKQKLYLA